MRFRLFGWVAVLALGGGAGACGPDTIDWGRECTPDEARRLGCYTCPYSCDPNAEDAGADAGADAGDASELGVTCDGQCVPSRPVGWLGPLLLWTGPSAELPSCPPQAPGPNGYDWHGDLQVPSSSCGACSCLPSAGSCTLPTSLTAGSSTCANSPGTHTTVFDAPAGWSGACTSLNHIPAGETCGSSPCVASLAIAPLEVTAGPCMPVTAVPPKALAPTTWGIAAAVCPGETSGSCNDPQKTCMPRDEPGFERCVFHEGDIPCALKGPFTIRHVLYTGVSDTRGCDPCTCGEAMGSACSAKVSIFTDLACTNLFETLSIDATKASCQDILPAGSALGSKSAGQVTFTPGFCQPSGGGTSGTVEPVGPTTYCCLPAP